MKPKIYLFAGHNNNDPGAISDGYKEADLTKELRGLIVEELLKRGARNSQIDNDADSLSVVLSKVNTREEDVILDIHFNAATPVATGTEVFISNNVNNKSKDFAKELVESTSIILKIANRGVKTEAQSVRKRLAVLNKNGKAALIEVCFITNKMNMVKYQANKYQLAAKYAEILIKHKKL